MDAPEPQQPGAGTVGSDVWLDSFLAAMTHSLSAARTILRDQHIADIGEYWTPLEKSEGSVGANLYRANLLRLQLEPDPSIPDSQAAVLDVPTAALAQQNSLALDSMTMDIDCTFIQFEQAEQGAPGRIALRFDRSGEGGSPVRMSLQFKRTDTPEGVARLGDIAVQRIR